MTRSSKKGPYIGVDLGASNVRAALIDDGRLGSVEAAPIDSEGSVDDVMEAVHALISRIWIDEVAGLGVGVPSVVDVERGVVYDVQNIPSMREVPVKSLIEREFGRPTFVNNDVNCFILGEHTFGTARGRRSVVGCNIGTGFAAGLIIDGKLYEGPNCGAGEFGMIPYLDSILEDFCSGLFFIRQGLDAADVHSAALGGDAAAAELWREFGRHLGTAMQVVMYSIDPEVIVLGGSIRKAYPLFEESMWSEIRKFAYRKSLERLELYVSDLDHAALLGAAQLPAVHGV